jgi:hypothetical protein
MSSAKITLIGLYNYDDTLFDLLQVPSGIDKQTLIDNMLLRSGDFEVMYPDPDFLKYSIGAWSRKWQATFSRWTKALSLEYNPLENYDRQEEWTDNRDVKGTESDTSKGSSNTSGSTGSTTTHKVSAYDGGNTFTDRDQDVLSGNDSSNGSSSMSRNGSHSLDDDLTHKGRVHGNIGVTTSQQMLQSELDLGYWNIYEKITDIFLTEFVLPIY